MKGIGGEDVKRVVTLWHYFPLKAVEEKSVDVVKADINKLLIRMGIKGYGQMARKLD